MKKICITAFLALSLCLAGIAHADPAQEAETTLRNAIDDILALLAQKQLDEDKLRTEIHGIFDFKALTARALGVHWRQFSASQQDKASDAMAQLLESTYRDALKKYTNQRVQYLETNSLREDQVEIRTEVMSNTQELPINYRMELTDGTWRIYDVVIEGVSLVQNYRTQFQEIMLNKSPDELISMLEEKAAKRRDNS
ncbi:MAG: MlaC/ttg2D family ABC transporter substrate-binding protein [Oceanidesulfovibrio sp.]